MKNHSDKAGLIRHLFLVTESMTRRMVATRLPLQKYSQAFFDACFGR
jgi:hypothetical protein